jgi:hypothetical protein
MIGALSINPERSGGQSMPAIDGFVSFGEKSDP